MPVFFVPKLPLFALVLFNLPFFSQIMKKSFPSAWPVFKKSLPLHSLSEREHENRSLTDCEQEVQDSIAPLLYGEGDKHQSFLYITLKRTIEQESLAGQTIMNIITVKSLILAQDER